jgi:hypothetical protein
MNRKKVIPYLSLAVLFGGSVSFGAITANAWEAGVEDSNTQYKTETSVDSADVTVQGWIGEWDITDPDSPEPVDPGNPDYVNVTLPIKVLYANAVDDQDNPLKTIISPEYRIVNNSTTNNLRVSVQEFTQDIATPVSQTLNIAMVNGKRVELQNKSGSFLTGKTHLADISTGSTETFTFTGEIEETSFPNSGSPAIKAQHNLKLHLAGLD